MHSLLHNNSSSIEYPEYLLKHILLCMRREEKIAAEIQKYEGNVYDLEQQTSEVAINAFTRTR